MLKVTIQGLGYVGSATAIALASRLNKNKKPIFKVTGVDLNNNLGIKKINEINKGRFPFKTNDNSIPFLLKKIKKNKNLQATFQKNSYKSSSIVIMSINFDLSLENRKFSEEFKKLKNSFSDIVNNISENTLILIETTLPPGTTEKILFPLMKSILKKRKLNVKKVYLAHSYERVTPGKNYINSIINYWRVFGGVNKESSLMCKKFLNKFVNVKKFPLTQLNNATCSELSKILENTFRAANIALIDEWSQYAEKLNIDLFEIIKAIKIRPTHSNILNPGLGVGGYCLTKDPLFGEVSAKKIFKFKKNNFEFSKKTILTNRKMPLRSVNKILEISNGRLKSKKILLLGATYKEDVADTRHSPSEIFYKNVKKKGAIIEVHDPLLKFWDEVNSKVLNTLPNFKNYDILFFAVKNNIYKKLDFNLKKLKKNVIIFDSNNVLTNKQILKIKKQKIKIFSIGRGR